MSLLVTREGLLTTVQDLGRVGYRSFGVNPGGVMDRTATRILNLLLGNDENAAVLEMHFPAGEYLFQSETVFAIGGADLSVELNDTSIENWRSFKANKGDQLRFVRRRSGARGYLAVAGGFSVQPWLGSSSTSLVTAMGGYMGRKLCIGDEVPFCTSSKISFSSEVKIGPSLLPPYSSQPKLRITAGPELATLSGLSQIQLFAQQFEVLPQSDRMGFRMNGQPLHRLSETEMLSSGTTFGTVQLLPDGQLIILMADHQTTGGYPRIATVASVDLPLIAQLRQGDVVAFKLIDHAEAERLAQTFERNLAYLKIGVRVANGGL